MGKNLNVFDVTNNEILDYNHLTKTKKIPVKIMINLKKEDGYYYGIYDWKDFTYSKNYDPKKSRKTTVRLKDGLDISKLTRYDKLRNHKIVHLLYQSIHTRRLILPNHYDPETKTMSYIVRGRDLEKLPKFNF